MGLVGAGYHEYGADYVFATVQTLNRDEHLLQYDKNTFDCIILEFQIYLLLEMMKRQIVTSQCLQVMSV